MAFKLYKGNAMATLPTERFIASGGITKDMPVKLVAGASGAELGKVAQLAGGAAATEVIYGIAQETVLTGVEVLIQPIHPSAVYVVDAVANANVTSVGVDNYLTATTLTITIGASTENGRKCKIIGQLGAAADKKYLVQLGNFGSEGMGATSAALVYSYTVAADATGAPTAFTAPFAMRIDDIIVQATATSGSGTITPINAGTAGTGTDAMCTAITCAADGAVTHMSAGADDTKLLLAVGEIVKVDAAGATDRGIVTFIGHRV